VLEETTRPDRINKNLILVVGVLTSIIAVQDDGLVVVVVVVECASTVEETGDQ
jgi:hypothetical protein